MPAKTVAVVTLSTTVVQFYAKQLHALFGELIQIVPYSFEDGSAYRIEPADHCFQQRRRKLSGRPAVASARQPVHPFEHYHYQIRAGTADGSPSGYKGPACKSQPENGNGGHL